VIGNDRFKDRTGRRKRGRGRQGGAAPSALQDGLKEVKKIGPIVPLAAGSAKDRQEIGVIAGPCSVESKSQLMEIAHAVKEAGAVESAAGRSSRARILIVPGTCGRRVGAAGAWRARRRGWRLWTEVMAVEQVSLWGKSDVLQSGREHAEFQSAQCRGEQKQAGGC